RDGLPRLLRNDQDADAELRHDARGLGRDGGRVSASLERLERLRPDVAPRLLDIFAVVFAVAFLESLEQHLRRFDKALARFAERNAEPFELDSRKSPPQAKNHAPVRHVIDHRHLLGDAHRVMPRHDDHHRSKLYRLGAAGEVGQELQHVGAHRVVVEMMLDAPDGIESERLIEIADMQIFRIDVAIRSNIVRILENYSSTNFHFEILPERGLKRFNETPFTYQPFSKIAK